MIKRERYLKFLTDAIDNEFIKVITGVRRSGKSVLLMQVQDELRNRGILPKISEIDSIRQFSTRLSLEQLVRIMADEEVF